jgi:type II secretory pathway component PulM
VRLPDPLQPYKLYVAVAAGGLALVLVCFVVWFVLIRPGQAEHAAKQANVNAAVATSGASAVKEAAVAVNGQVKSEAQIDIRVKGSRDAILSSAGAAGAVDPALADAGLRALCMSDAHAADSGCHALLDAHP